MISNDDTIDVNLGIILFYRRQIRFPILFIGCNSEIAPTTVHYTFNLSTKSTPMMSSNDYIIVIDDLRRMTIYPIIFTTRSNIT